MHLYISIWSTADLPIAFESQEISSAAPLGFAETEDQLLAAGLIQGLRLLHWQILDPEVSYRLSSFGPSWFLDLWECYAGGLKEKQETKINYQNLYVTQDVKVVHKIMFPN